MLVPHTDDNVIELYLTARSLGPPSTSPQYGFLYATDSAARRNVAIPFQHPMNTPFSIEDLLLNIWVPHGVGRSEFHGVRVSEYSLGTGLLLEHEFTIFFVPPSRHPTMPINHNRSLCTTVPWYGNVLVVKHGTCKPVINVIESEGKLIDNIVTCEYDDTATTPRFTTHAHRALHSPHLHISDTVLAPRIADGAPPTTSGRWERLRP
ncbi:hypothetical protein C8J57DRAFT_1529147 [Mycena rebaudengoi]|nr:hypothetical protein C8J57DRAFT_1529147 [Mycena rebaudengoi]